MTGSAGTAADRCINSVFPGRQNVDMGGGLEEEVGRDGRQAGRFRMTGGAGTAADPGI